MVKHLVMWNFKEDFPEEKKEALAKEADARLKALVGQIKGLTFAEMKLNRLLAAYQVHPLHVAVATEIIKPATCDRACFDYEV